MALVVKNLPANAGDARDVGLIHGLGRSCGGGSGNPLQYSCLENSTDRGAWWATVYGVTESQTQLGAGQSTEMVVQHCGHTSCDSAVHFKIANFLLHELHLNFFFFKKRKR